MNYLSYLTRIQEIEPSDGMFLPIIFFLSITAIILIVLGYIMIRKYKKKKK